MGSIKKWMRKLRYKVTPPRRIFSEYYHLNLWKNKNSKSGAGSDLRQTSHIREELPSLLKKIHVTSLFDAACGDFFWLQSADLGPITYVGADIVPEMIERNQREYGNKMREFINLNIIEDPLPFADVILCRDCLVHLSYKHILSAIQNFKKSQTKHLITTTFPGCLKNKDIITGAWRPINLQLPPFNFPPPTHLIREQCTEADSKYPDKSLGLWLLKDIGFCSLK